MVHVGHMRVAVPHAGVPMRMDVRFSRWITGQVLMLVVLIVNVRMAVLNWLVLVVFGEV